MTTRARIQRSSRTASGKRGSTRRSTNHDLHLESSSFSSLAPIPVRYTADGQNLSPPLSWDAPPKGTETLALLCEDPDAPTPRPFIHWLVANLAPHASGGRLNEGVTVMPGAVLGKTSFGQIGYGGPEPPRGHLEHHYHFKVFAVDTILPLSDGFSKEDLLRLMKGHVLATGELTGTYRR